MSDILIGLDKIFKQSEATAEWYLMNSIKMLKDFEVEYTTSDAIALAAVMASDCNSMTIALKLQQIRDKICNEDE
jgi:hypothetical protein